jgi:hypothetical protein
MDWHLAIERNREALKRVLAAIVAMAGPEMRGQFYPVYPITRNSSGRTM